MNATAYISSGILERHLVGLTSPEEVKELEEMMAHYPEVQKEIKDIQKALHGYVLLHQVAPPDDLRQKVITGAKPATTPAVKKPVSKQAPKPMNSGKAVRVEASVPPINWWIVFVAAFGLGLIALGIYASKLSNEVEEGKLALAAKQEEVKLLRTEKEAQIKQYETVKAELDLRSDPDVKPFLILGNNRAPGANAVVYWNATSRKSYLDVRSLPPVPEGKQLQFWVMSNGKSQNLGSPKVNSPGVLQDLTFVESPNLYFFTLENAGDAPSRPNRWQTVMSGRVNY